MKTHKEKYEKMYNIGGVVIRSPTKIRVRRVIGLAFVPPDQVEAAFAELVDAIPRTFSSTTSYPTSSQLGCLAVLLLVVPGRMLNSLQFCGIFEVAL